MYVFCADFVWVSYWYMYGFRADFVWIPYRCMYEFRADFVWKSYSNLVWKVVAKSHTFPINFPHLQLVHFPYESRTPLFTGICLISLSSDNVVRYYIIYSMYGFVTFVCIFIFVDLCYNENNSFLKIILFSYLYE